MSDFSPYPVRERDIYLEASQHKDAAALAAFLDEACGDDGTLRKRIERLLDVTPRSDLFEPDPLVREVMAKLSESEIAAGAGNGTRIPTPRLAEQ